MKLAAAYTREPTKSAGRKGSRENRGRERRLRLNPRVLILGHAEEPEEQ